MIAEPGAPSLHEQLPPHPGGRKRKAISVETLMRKRVAAPGDAHAFDDGTR
jgi:general transcription factor IIIA